jgi:hypothetical protein
VTQSFGDILGPEPDGSYIVTLGVDTMGGELPLTYTLTWSDGYTQTGNGTFQRDFPGYPNSLQGTVSVVSTDGQHASVSVTAPFTPG